MSASAKTQPATSPEAPTALARRTPMPSSALAHTIAVAPPALGKAVAQSCPGRITATSCGRTERRLARRGHCDRSSAGKRMQQLVRAEAFRRPGGKRCREFCGHYSATVRLSHPHPNPPPKREVASLRALGQGAEVLLSPGLGESAGVRAYAGREVPAQVRERHTRLRPRLGRLDGLRDLRARRTAVISARIATAMSGEVRLPIFR